MSDQHDHWNAQYANSDPDRPVRPASRFCEFALGHFPKSSRVLEIGCGRGADAARMVEYGHRVLATDFSESVIAENQARYAEVAGLTFQTMTIAAPLPLADNGFDVIYAHLSLHYLPDLETRHVFREFHRVLRPGGVLAFLCKSIGDPLYGKGTLLEADMYEVNGHVRHFFSEEYADSLLEGLFSLTILSTGQETYYQRESAFVQVVAHREFPSPALASR